MTASEFVKRFESELEADQDLRPIVAIIAPYRAAMGSPETIAKMLDQLAGCYARARGVAFTEVAASR